MTALVEGSNTELQTGAELKMTTEQNFSSGQLMNFLENFQRKMEDKMEDTRKSIETTNQKIDGRLDGIDKEVRNLNQRMDSNEETGQKMNKRMDERMAILENEMKNSIRLRRRSEELRVREKELSSESEKAGNENRRDLRQDKEEEKELQKKNDKDREEKRKKVDDVTKTILEEPTGTFRSSWARGIQKELEMASKVISKDLCKDRRNDKGMIRDINVDGKGDTTEDKNDNVDIPECWEERWNNDPALDKMTKKKTPVIRKPPRTDWFGLNSSSSDSEEEDMDWTEVDRRRKKEEKKRRAKKRKNDLKKECATRAANMFSIGPISVNTVEFFMKKGLNFEEAKVGALKEFLNYNLNYDEDELEQLKVAETRLSKKGDDFLNVALVEQDDVRELYGRKAASRNDNIILRSYIPPNFFERYMCLTKICKDMRTEEPSLKTQLRFGTRDIELYTKTKGEESGFKRIELNEFTDMTRVPEFDPTIKWKRYVDKPPSRKDKNWEDRGQRPSTMGQQSRERYGWKQKEVVNSAGDEDPASRNLETGLIRSNSNTTNSQSKKQRLEAESSSSDGEDSRMDSEGDSSQFSTPAAQK